MGIDEVVVWKGCTWRWDYEMDSRMCVRKWGGKLLLVSGEYVVWVYHTQEPNDSDTNKDLLYEKRLQWLI